MQRKLVIGFALTIALGVIAATVFTKDAAVRASAAHSAICLRGEGCVVRPAVSASAKVRPAHLSSRRGSPVRLSLGVMIDRGGPSVPELSKVAVNFDRRGSIQANGLPTCGKRTLEALGRRAAQTMCRRAIVGRGNAVVVLGTAQRALVPLTLFNGGTASGTHRLLVHAATPVLGPPVVMPMRITRLRGGPYGLRATLQIPPIDDGSGHLLKAWIDVRRVFRDNGVRKSYAAAKCSGRPVLEAKFEFLFEDYTKQSGRILRPCTPRD